MLTDLDKALDAALHAVTQPGQQFELATADIGGDTLNVFKAAPPTMREYFAAFFALRADMEYLVYNDERYTFADVYAKSLKIAAALQHEYGIAKGDRVAIAMRNFPEWVMAYVGLLHLGAVAVPLNAWWQAEEFEYGLADSGTRLVIADKERLARLQQIDGYAVPTVTVRTSREASEAAGAKLLDDLLETAPTEIWPLPPLSADDDATIMYTSGSTGFPKGAVSTHRGVVHGTLNYLAQGLAMLKLAEATGVELPEQQCMLLTVPLFHITGSVVIMLVSIGIGRKLILLHKWDPGEAMQLIEKEKCTVFTGVPTMTHEIMQHPDRNKYDLSTVIDWAAGGAPRPPEHVERLAKEMPSGKPALGYGLTETNGVGASNYRENYVLKPASTGRASKPLVDIKIVDDDGQTLPAHERGEICIQTSANVRGYWRRPKETREAFRAGGWFHTGDVGYLDEDGYLFIVDRKKDIIIRGGENISCQEVEAAIYTHSAVAEACVFGLPDDRLGEIVGAIAYLKPGESLTTEALVESTKSQLAAFKVPAVMWISETPLPKLGSAKIDKVSLRKLHREIYLADTA